MVQNDLSSPKPLSHSRRDPGQRVPGTCPTSPSKSAAEAGLELGSQLWVQGTYLSTCSFACITHGHASDIEFLSPEIPRALGLSRMDPAKGLQKSSSVYAGGAGWWNWAMRQVGAVPVSISHTAGRAEQPVTGSWSCVDCVALISNFMTLIRPDLGASAYWVSLC